MEKTLSDEIRIFKEGEEIWTDGTNEILLVDETKKHLQEFKEELKDELFTTNFASEQIRIIDTQMQKHFGGKLI